MPKIATKLTDLQVRRIDQPGWHAVGGVAGLLLQVRKPVGASTKLARSWVLRIQNGLKRVPLGLGSYPQLILKEAREKARRLVLEARDGVDLLASKRARRQALLDAQARSKTFVDVAAEYIEAHSTDYSNDKHRKQWAEDDLDEHHAAIRTQVRFKLLGRSSLGHSEIKNRAGLEHGFCLTDCALNKSL